MINIAIDGPSGAGKSTIAKIVAKRLDIIYLDTGAMYRALGYKAITLGIDPNDCAKVLPMIADTSVEIKYVDGEQSVFLDGKNVSPFIREHNISKAASDISKIPQVRIKLVEIQREIANTNNVVLDGRDITSYVLPNAKYKFYLTANAEERARRRYEELRAKGSLLTFEQILADIVERDKNDSSRAFAPLICTPDSIFVDSTKMSAEEVVEMVLSNIKE